LFFTRTDDVQQRLLHLAELWRDNEMPGIALDCSRE
jgi:hypothetical protein